MDIIFMIKNLREPSQYQDVVLPVQESHYKDKTVLSL